MLTGLRVLDASDHRGQLAGQILADLGAEVILIEPPGGSPSRRVGPFIDGHEQDPDGSLWFWSYNRGKRSVVLDLHGDGADPARADADRERFRELVRSADVLIDSAIPGSMSEAGRGLGPSELAELNPALVHTSITPFGQDGPKARWHATDLIVVAAGMQLSMMGDSDRPPVRVPLEQAFLHASAEAAAATLIALRERRRSGLGQHVDVSAQQAILQATQSYALSSLLNAAEIRRMSGGTKAGPFNVRVRSKAADGYVSNTILFGEAIGPFGRRLFEWIHAEGECTDDELHFEWIDFVAAVTEGRRSPAEYDHIQDVAEAFTAKRTKAELLAEALRRRLLLVPIANVADVVEAEHYQVRDYWRTVEPPALGRPIRVPGPFVKCSKTPLQIPTTVPGVGADTEQVLADVTRRPDAPVPVPIGMDAPAGGALEGVKILDFMWVMAGPASTRVLADHGATVVRVETFNRTETARTIGPFLNDLGGSENSGLYQNMNAGKLGITLDLAKPEARGVIEDLVRWADIVTDSFSPKAMRGWGLTYEDLCAIKPDIIVASTCLFGQYGPLSSLAGFGTMGAAMSGFYEMTGWPDRPPAGVFGAYTDYLSPRYLTCALLAALEHRERTGEGQYLDLSQAEASMGFLAPAVLDYGANGRLAPAMGNRHPTMVPHGVFPVAGEDRWIAIAVEGDEQWRALCCVAGFGGELAALDGAARRAREDELEATIAAWTNARDGFELQQTLQDGGVAAHVVQTSADLATDPQLVHRNHFRNVAHADHGTFWIEGPRFKLSRSPDQVRNAGPSLGQHTFVVLVGILGYDDERVGEVAAAGVLE
ncbi:MAG: CaiB/BaiF CoA transferase family protein [Acidimicrobiia bacterium]